MACHLFYFCYIFPTMRAIASEQLIIMGSHREGSAEDG